MTINLNLVIHNPYHPSYNPNTIPECGYCTTVLITVFPIQLPFLIPCSIKPFSPFTAYAISQTACIPLGPGDTTWET